MTSPTPQTSGVRLRPAAQRDLEITLAWQIEPGARRYFRDTRPPTRSEHEAWFRERLDSPEPTLWIIEFEDQPVGAIRLDNCDGSGATRYEVSILIASHNRGKGIGAIALSCLRSDHPDSALVATISPENKASIAAFIRAGFQQTAPERYEANGLSSAEAADAD